MDQNNMTAKIVSSVITAVVIGVVAFMFLGKIDSYLRIKAIDECGKISKYEITAADGSHVSYPINDVYKSCLKDKGITQ